MSSVIIDFSDSPVNESKTEEVLKETPGTLGDHIQHEVAGHMWQAGTQSAKRFIDMYGQLDYLRPYFNVEPAVVCKRVVRSLVPNLALSAPQEAPDELYGPTMIIFSLVAILLFGMKMSQHVVVEGTLIGTALAVCFGYWMVTAVLLTFLAYLFNSAINYLQVLSLTGYSLFGHCLALLFAIIFGHLGHPAMYYVPAILLGGLSSMKLVGVYMSRSWSQQSGAILSAVAVVIHIGYLLYLKMAYHKVYEALV